MDRDALRGILNEIDPAVDPQVESKTGSVTFIFNAPIEKVVIGATVPADTGKRRRPD